MGLGWRLEKGIGERQGAGECKYRAGRGGAGRGQAVCTALIPAGSGREICSAAECRIAVSSNQSSTFAQ